MNFSLGRTEDLQNISGQTQTYFLRGESKIIFPTMRRRAGRPVGCWQARREREGELEIERDLTRSNRPACRRRARDCVWTMDHPRCIAPPSARPPSVHLIPMMSCQICAAAAAQCAPAEFGPQQRRDKLTDGWTEGRTWDCASDWYRDWRKFGWLLTQPPHHTLPA